MDLAWQVAVWAMVVFGILFGLLFLTAVAATIWAAIIKFREDGQKGREEPQEPR